LRHGRASEIRIVIDLTPREVALKVTDNGTGFATNGGPAGDDAEHLGLLGMHERAERVGGRLTITSVPGAGTTISAIVPMETR
jgi:signal transduction histidine kinase